MNYRMVSDAREIYDFVMKETRKLLEEQTSAYEKKIILLEKEIGVLKNIVTVLQDEIKETKNIASDLRQDIKKSKFIGIDSNMTKQNNNKKSTGKIDVNRYDISTGFKYDGWIYYRNKEMGNFLYKVRLDGTENTKLTDYSVSLSCGFSVKGNKFYFFDASFDKRSINL